MNCFAEPLPDKTCLAIETLLTEKIESEFNERDIDSYARVNKALVYANMYSYGCQENKEGHKAAALRELEIGRALETWDNEPWGLVIRLYKKLEMPDDAGRVADKAKANGENPDVVDAALER